MQRFGAILAELESELDWTLLGRAYCHAADEEHADGTGFFDAERIEHLRDVGLHLASDLAQLLGQFSRTGRSLYVGAALFELAPLLFEATVLGREVVAQNLDCVETREINRALDAVSGRLELDLPRLVIVEVDDSSSADSISGPVACDHLWLVSVLTDPDAFPALSDELYERPPRIAARAALNQDRARARALVARSLRGLEPPALLTTSDEELELLRQALFALDCELDVPETARDSALVGDAVRHCRVTRHAP